MPVIIRESRKIAGKVYDNIKVYKTDRPLTTEAKKQAEELDDFLSTKLSDILNDIKKKDLLKLKNKPGVLRLWYEVGKNLTFINDTSIIPAEDRKYIWRAIYDHAKELKPGKLNVRAVERPENSHFAYCYNLSKYSWDFIKNAGNWTAWVEFFDSLVIRKDNRIIEWLGTIQNFSTGSKQNWLRKLTRKIRRDFKNIDTKVFSDSELDKKLLECFKHVYPDISLSMRHPT